MTIFTRYQASSIALRIGLLVGLVGCESQVATSIPAPVRNTELARVENDRAFKLIEEGKYAEAETVLRRAVGADNLFGPARNNLGLVYFHTDRLYLAAWEFENAIKFMPSRPEPRNNLGLVLEKAGKMDEAVGAFEKARALQPDNPEFIGNLARAKIQDGSKDPETRKLLERVVSMDSRPEWRHWARMNLFRLRQAEGAATSQPIQP